VEPSDRLNDSYKNDWDLIYLFSNVATYEGNSSKAGFIFHSFDSYQTYCDRLEPEQTSIAEQRIGNQVPTTTNSRMSR
jgi:hypothetical protein